jgi:hypothetical protein
MAEAEKSIQLKARGRIIAFEIRPRRFGFVVLEVATLLDWGVRNFGTLGLSDVGPERKEIAHLMAFYRPTAVVFRKRIATLSPDARAIIRNSQQVVASEATRHSIPVRTVSAALVSKFFATHGCGPKHERAALVADWFEELRWNVPPRRKAWEPERQNAVVFDAAATGIAFLGTQESQSQVGSL